jgi:hypothetical protein
MMNSIKQCFSYINCCPKREVVLQNTLLENNFTQIGHISTDKKISILRSFIRDKSQSLFSGEECKAILAQVIKNNGGQDIFNAGLGLNANKVDELYTKYEIHKQNQPVNIESKEKVPQTCLGRTKYAVWSGRTTLQKIGVTVIGLASLGGSIYGIVKPIEYWIDNNKPDNKIDDPKCFDSVDNYFVQHNKETKIDFTSVTGCGPDVTTSLSDFIRFVFTEFYDKSRDPSIPKETYHGRDLSSESKVWLDPVLAKFSGWERSGFSKEIKPNLDAIAMPDGNDDLKKNLKRMKTSFNRLIDNIDGYVNGSNKLNSEAIKQIISIANDKLVAKFNSEELIKRQNPKTMWRD